MYMYMYIVYIVCTFCILIITNVCTQTCTCVFEHYFPQKELFTLINFSNNFVYMRYTVYIHIIILCCCMYIFLYSWPAICIHGDKAQNEREWVMSGK